MSKVLALGLAALVLAGCGASATTTTTTRTVTQTARAATPAQVPVEQHANTCAGVPGNHCPTPSTACPRGEVHPYGILTECVAPSKIPVEQEPAGKPLCSGAKPYYSAGQCYATPQTAVEPTPPSNASYGADTTDQGCPANETIYTKPDGSERCFSGQCPPGYSTDPNNGHCAPPSSYNADKPH
jgi:hypothetical protein